MALPVGPAITESLEIYEDKHGDPTAANHSRFYADHPDAEELFAGDVMIPRRMMAGILGIIVDLADGTLDPAYSTTWVADHVAYEVTKPMIDSMFAVIVDEIRDGLDDSWTPSMETEWGAVMTAWSERTLTQYVVDDR